MLQKCYTNDEFSYLLFVFAVSKIKNHIFTFRKDNLINKNY